MRYSFEEYFGDGEDEIIPYEDRAEELGDRLRLIDIILENYMDIIMEHEQGLVFHRGVPMTPEQIEIIYEQDPTERGIDMLDYETLETVERAFYYIKKREEATPEEVFLPFRVLRKEFALSDFEEFALMLSAACDENLTYGRMLGFLVQNQSGHSATFGSVLVLYESMKGEGAQLIYDTDKMDSFFFRPDESRSVPGMRYFRTMRLYPPMREFIFGEGEAFMKKESYRETGNIPIFFNTEADMLSGVLSDKGEANQIFFEAIDGADVLHLLSGMARDRGLPLYLLDESDSEEDEEIGTDFLYRLIIARLYPGFVALRVDNTMSPIASSESGDVSDRFISEHRDKIRRVLKRIRNYLPTGPLFIYGPEKMPEKVIPEEYAPVIFPLAIPDRHHRKEIWEYFFNKSDIVLSEDLDLEELADRYDFSYGMIHTVVLRAALQMSAESGDVPERKSKSKTKSAKSAKAKSDNVLKKDVLLPVLFRRNAANFGVLATYIPAAYTWDDIEMDKNERRILMTACDRFRYRGRLDEKYGIADRNAYGNGVSVLMYGPPGTGKTMAARVISSELALPLYRVDVSQISSKYIGETEKNLGKIFNEAAKSNVILFFDEADSLFAKRTDVSDSHDKHANAQTAYLLQKIEEFSGITLLATNLYHNFDTAFVRRITYVVRFDAPDAATRQRLWENSLPKSVPMEEGIDFEFLAERFELSGSNIKSILMSAAYMAGNEDKPVSAAHIVRAMRYEFVKLGRIIDPPEFGKYVMYLY